MSEPVRDGGFTLIEVLVTIVLMGVMMAISVATFNTWARAGQHSGTADEVESTLRQTQQRAVTEGRAMCVQFDSSNNNYTVFTGACADPGRVRTLGPVETDAPSVRLGLFTPESGTASGVTFYARGTATPGTVRVTRTGNPKVYTVNVEGLTGRVFVS